MNEMHNKNEGFTLVELIIVVAIMGVLIALLAPVYARHVEKSRETVDIANVRSAYAEKKIPVIVSKANGGFYISETTTANRNPKNKEDYVAIADHIYNDSGFQKYTAGKKYDTLKEAYEAYSKLLKEGNYSEYKDTLPK